ncbi:MAG: leucine-rich repeat domain-containing protein [Patescibacteria group bacterium]|nr:leucine-rich repeat domain-containing protein [Patescibacteria group bacterium]
MKIFTLVLLSLLVLGGGCSTNQDLSDNPSVQPKKIDEKPVSTSASTLDLSGRGLTSIPSDVFSRTNLESLDLSDNRLTGAPQAEIRHLQKLKNLDLSGNDLTGLPAELGQLKDLEVLDVSDNRLTGLPLELGNLTQLRILDITGNQYSKQDLDQIAAKLTNTEIRR